VRDAFARFATAASHWVGSPASFVVHLVVVAGWLVLGPRFGWSDTWQLAMTTALTVATELVAVLIANAQNRDARALHAKLDELIRVTSAARDELIELEDAPEATVEAVRREIKEGCHGAD
jgi:low affinity Fe/Cu permease